MQTWFHGGMSPRSGGQQSPAGRRPLSTFNILIRLTAFCSFLLIVQFQALTRSATFNLLSKQENLVLGVNQQPTIFLNRGETSMERKLQSRMTMLRASRVTHATDDNDREKLYSLNEEQTMDEKDSSDKEVKQSSKEHQEDDDYYENESKEDGGEYPLDDKTKFVYPLTWELEKAVPSDEPRHIVPKQERGALAAF
jgi:hypothetical protein